MSDLIVNVCMAVRDRPQETKRSLVSLRNDPVVKSFSIVDDQSMQETEILLGDFWKFCVLESNIRGVEVVRNNVSLGVGGSKNLAAENVKERGKYLVFSDNDAIWGDGSLARLIDAYEASKPHGIRILGGYAHPYNGTNRVIEAGGFTIHTKNAVDGLSWLLEWDTWDKYGRLMDNARGVRQSEDWEYCQRIRNDGYEVGVLFPHPVYNNGLIDTFGDEIPGAQQVREQQGAI